MLQITVFGQKIAIQWDHDADFSRYRTFTIRQGYLNSCNPALNSDTARHEIEDAIRSHLSGRGMTETDGAADLNVRFSLGGVNRMLARYGKRALVIDLRDPQKRDLVWRGIASGGATIDRDLTGVVRKAIEKYPPKNY